jgi:hypothetical protein
VQNTGYLPTYVSKTTLNKKYVRGVVAEIELPEGATLVEGKQRQEGPQLVGRSHHHTLVSFFPGKNATEDRHRFTWIVRAKKNVAVSLRASHERAGGVNGNCAVGS